MLVFCVTSPVFRSICFSGHGRVGETPGFAYHCGRFALVPVIFRRLVTCLTLKLLKFGAPVPSPCATALLHHVHFEFMNSEEISLCQYTWRYSEHLTETAGSSRLERLPGGFFVRLDRSRQARQARDTFRNFSPFPRPSPLLMSLRICQRNFFRYRAKPSRNASSW